MAIVYRLELKDEQLNKNVNAGVYRYNTPTVDWLGSACDGGNLQYSDEYSAKHPTPDEDPKLRNTKMKTEYVFCFTSANQLHTWFSNIHNVEQFLLNYIQIGIYYVPDKYYIKGTFQAIAHMDYMTRVDQWEPTRRG